MKLLVDYAMSFVGTEYRWGGTSPIKGWDCSEYSRELLKSVGLGPKEDVTAAGLCAHLLIHGEESEPKTGAFVIYGKDTDNIIHIDFMIDDNRVIGMRGGDSSTTNSDRADLARAFCKIRPFGDRKDILYIIMPKYPSWIEI